jgi:hypothetical protein
VTDSDDNFLINYSAPMVGITNDDRIYDLTPHKDNNGIFVFGLNANPNLVEESLTDD